MPVPRLRGMDDRVDYVIVRKTAEDTDENMYALEARYDPTTTTEGVHGSSLNRRQIDPSTLDFDGDAGDDDDATPDEAIPSITGPPPILLTMTLPQAQATGSALADNAPVETVVVQITPPPRPPPPPHRGGIAKTTEHLLIAAGSIGATIIVVMIILAIHTMRKRGLTLREAVQQGRYQVTRRGPPPPPPKARRWDGKAGSNTDYGSMRKDTVTPPPRAMSIARSGSTSSQRPLMALQRSESFNTRQHASPETVPHSFFLESPRSNSHRRNNSQTPSSPVLPLQNQRRSASTRNTRSISNASELKYPEPPVERALSPLPAPPSFKQFLFNRPTASGRQGNGTMESRFSWTNSNAPQTPHEHSRDTNSHMVGRDSFMTQRSSVPRFRTVDSWVNQQANRVEEQKLREQFRMTQSTIQSNDDERYDSIPEVPEIPTHMNTAATPDTSVTLVKPLTPLPLRSGGLPGKNVKHERHDTRTTVETAPIFRQHPGTEVRFSTRSVVPSEILDMGRKPNVLS